MKGIAKAALILVSTKIHATASNSSMERCRQKAEYERLTDGTCIQSERARSYRCGRVHFKGEVFLCHAHAYQGGHKNLHDDAELAEWVRRVIG
jgi:hypothetical protein